MAIQFGQKHLNIVFKLFLFFYLLLAIFDLSLLLHNFLTAYESFLIMEFGYFNIFFFIILNVQNQIWNVINMFLNLTFVLLCFFIFLADFFDFVFNDFLYFFNFFLLGD